MAATVSASTRLSEASPEPPVAASAPTAPAQPPGVVDDPQPSGKKPNVLIFTTDDQRVGTLNGMPATRRLLARRGVTFKNAFATTPLCCPSRASVLTGQYAHNHGVESNALGRSLKTSDTLHHHLRDAGYLTALIGKYVKGWNLDRLPPDFDEVSLLAPANSRRAQGSNSYYDTPFSINGRIRLVKRYATDFLAVRTGRTLARFDRQDKRPWLMYVNTFAPHSPAVPARRHATASVRGLHSNPGTRERDRRDKAPQVQKIETPMRGMREYAIRQQRTLLAVDELVADVFKQLRKRKETRNTLILFTSDNGYMWGEHGLRSKRWPYTASIKVPLLMRWPGDVRPNSREGRMVTNVDIAPTVYDAAGVQPDHVMDGRSLLMRGRRRTLLLEHWERRPWLSLRTRRYQYIEYYEENHGEPPYRELYDLKRDPWQLNNLLWRGRKRHRAVAGRLQEELIAKAGCEGEACF